MALLVTASTTFGAQLWSVMAAFIIAGVFGARPRPRSNPRLAVIIIAVLLALPVVLAAEDLVLVRCPMTPLEAAICEITMGMVCLCEN